MRQADYQSISTTQTQLLFQYTVQNTDGDTDGATINANGLKLNGGRIHKNGSTTNADLAHAALTNQSTHKVDGIAPGLIDADVMSDELTLAYDEVLDSNSRPATGDFAVMVDSEARSVSAVAVSSSEVKLTFASAVTVDQRIRLTYTPGTNPIRDQAQNPAIALTNLTAANRVQVQLVNVCTRTSHVRVAIVAASPVSTCGDVTAKHLSAITRLTLNYGNISTLQANDFSGLTALTRLSLSGNRLSTLPENLFSGLTALKTLILNDNNLSGLNANIFSNLSALTRLDLHDNELTSLPANIFSNLSALTRLDLYDNNLTSLDASAFSGLRALETLLLENNNLDGLDASAFSDLTALETLHLHWNNLSSLNASAFSGLRALKVLSLFENDLQSTSLPTGVFSNLTALETLLLGGNQPQQPECKSLFRTVITSSTPSRRPTIRQPTQQPECKRVFGAYST